MGLNTETSLPSAPAVDLDDGAIAYFREQAPIIYGAGSAGRQLLKLFAEAGIAVACCIDKNAESIGSIGEIPVLPPTHLCTLATAKQYPLIVAVNSRHTYESISGELMRAYPRLSTPTWSRLLIDAFAVERCKQRLTEGSRLDLRECMGCRADPSGCEAFRQGACSIAVDGHIAGPSKLKDFAYFVTNRCTLNCLHCVEKLPYYEQRTTEKSQRILETVRKVVKASGFIYRFSITGGETLLNRELPDLIDGLLATPGIGYIYLYTSGTVVPKPALAARLAHPRIAVNVSDYGAYVAGKLHENLDQCLAAFDKYGVAYRLLSNKFWFDLGQFEALDLDAQALRKSFSSCAFTNCMTISDGVLYRCPHQLAGIQLGRLSLPDGETVDIDRLEGRDLAESLDRFVDLDYIDACRHCQLSTGAKEVPAAIQVARRTLPITPV